MITQKRKCSVKPFEGTNKEKYIFISYCHKDRRFVFPLIEQLTRDGYRVWYDDGTQTEAEWPEVIAQHLSGSSVCIAVISENSINSHNCRREINFALLKRKTFLSVILDKTEMSLGMQMQLSSAPSLCRYELTDDKEFFSKLYGTDVLKTCFFKEDPSVIVSSPEDYEEEAAISEVFDNEKTFSDSWFRDFGLPSRETARDIDFDDSEKNTEKLLSNSINCDTIMLSAYIVREKSEKIFRLEKDETKIGRSRTVTDYCISGNSAVGRLHALIVKRDKEYYLSDNNSTNKTFLNSKELIPEKAYLLKNGDRIRLANENFTFWKKES